VSHNPSLSDLRRFNVRNLRGQGVVTARTDTRIPSGPRGMNDWERRYATHLTVLQRGGIVQWWAYEALRFKLGRGAWFKPDFAVLLADGTLELHEVKGHWREAARVRIKVAASMYPFRFVVVRPDGESWTREEVER
jgi:hypothetical protein